MNRNFTQKSIRFYLLLLCVSVWTSGAQELKKPILDFSDACVTAEHKGFPVEFVWNPNPGVNADNEFIIELSDATGSFASAVILDRLGDHNSIYKFRVEALVLPQTVGGENYKLRWRSTSPAKTSPASDSFAAYFISLEEPLVVNNYKDAFVCDGTSVYLEVDNYPNQAAYNWYHNSELIPGKHGSSLEVTEPGIYFAEVNYGSFCSAATASNFVEVYIENSIDFDLIGAKTLSLCQGQSYTLTTDLVDPAMIYAWYKNGELIERNHKNTWEVHGSDPGFAGDYYVILEREGGCKETTSTVSITAGEFQVNLLTPDGTLLFPNETVAVSVETDALNPKFQWYRNGSILSGETAKTIQVSVAGDYYVTIAQQDVCIVTRTSDMVVVQEPSSYIATINAEPYAACESKSTLLHLEGLVGVLGEDTHKLDPNSLENFSYQWRYNNKEVTGATQKSLTVSDACKNGKYTLHIAIESGIEVVSNAFDLHLSLALKPQIEAAQNVRCDNGNSIEIYSSIVDDQYRYTWFRNDTALSEKSPRLTTNLSGTYQLEIGAFGCTVRSNDFIIEELDPSIVQLNVPNVVVIPEGQTKTITASGGDSYQWFNSTNELIGNKSSITVQQEGAYTLIAGVGFCQLAKNFKVTNLVSYVIPNVITPNGDGFNDLWVIPDSYAYQKKVSVNIFRQSGAMVYSTTDYQNNWPESSSIQYTAGQPPIYYYSITKGKETLKKGTITVIR